MRVKIFKRYRIIKSLKPIDLFDIVTRGYCDRNDFINSVESLQGEWYLNNWKNSGKIEIDVLDFYLSDTGFSHHTTREEAERLELEFKNSNLYTEVWSSWYGGKTWIFGFTYSDEAFRVLYLEWERDIKLQQILI
jgi:hypothetical protein